jgi:diaminohydroxyphosphoribosylaminopyrimidine deaminase/5-amino-6-(5-phosphoribosylamino)uracil reductase
MFSGIIKDISHVVYLLNETDVLRIGLYYKKNVPIGSSIAVNGVCLTVKNIEDDIVYFDVMRETLSRTTLKNLTMNSCVNIEPAIHLKDALDGTVTLGHVDTIATVFNIIDNEYIFELNSLHKDLVVKKGSIVIDGICLTIVRVYDNTFSVCIVPHTMNYVRWKSGDVVNIEYDYFLKSKIRYTGTHEDIVFNDTHGMAMAIEEGKKGRKTSSPNPWVGAICVTDRKVVSRGYHVSPGSDHAEAMCLNTCISCDTMYITLEPCCHWGRTPPCCDLLIKRGIKRVVIGVLDPDERVRGRGMKTLVDAGIQVKLLNSHEVRESLKEYLHHRSTGRPYVYFKLATSLNNKITNKHTNNRITCQKAIEDTHVYRSIVDGIGVGKNTWNIDKPSLTVRYPSDVIHKKQPIKIVWGEIEADENIIVMSKNQPLDKDLIELGDRGFVSILVEGGKSLFQSFVNAGCINELIIYTSNTIVDDDELSVFDNIIGLELHPVSSDIIGTTLKVVYRL